MRTAQIGESLPDIFRTHIAVTDKRFQAASDNACQFTPLLFNKRLYRLSLPSM